jgi:hypothetical protein
MALTEIKLARNNEAALGKRVLNNMKGLPPAHFGAAAYR